MHNAIRWFVEKHLDKLQGKVLEVGSRGHGIRDILPNYVGVDMEDGPNVDVVCKAEKLVHKFGEESFDAVMTLDAFEHMQNWRECLQGMWGVLKKEGWLIFTIAAQSKGYHGYPHDYWRMNWEIVDKIFPEAADMWRNHPSMGFVVQKKGPLPDLSKIELIPVK